MSYLSSFELKEFNAASLTGAYQNLGSALSSSCYGMVIYNDSDVDVYISTDGSTDQIRIPNGEKYEMHAYNRHFSNTQAAFLLKTGAQLYIKQVTAAGTGAISVNLATVG